MTGILSRRRRRQNMTARRTAKNSILVLQAYQIEIGEIQKLGSLLIRRQIVLRERESYPLWVGIPGFRIVHRHGEQPCRATLSGNRFAQISGKSSNSALARKIVAHDGDAAREPRCRLRANGRRGRLTGSHGAPVNEFERSGRGCCFKY